MGVFKAVTRGWLGTERRHMNGEVNEKTLFEDDGIDDVHKSEQRRSLDSQRPVGNEKVLPREFTSGRASIELGRLPPVVSEAATPRAAGEPTGKTKLWVSFHYGRPTRVELNPDEADVDDVKKRLMVLYPRHLGHLEAFEFGLKLQPHSTEIIPEDTPVQFLCQGNSVAAPIYVDIPASNKAPSFPSPRRLPHPAPTTAPHPLPLSPVFSPAAPDPEKEDNTHHRRYSLNSGSARSSARSSFGSEDVHPDSGDDPSRRAGSVDRDSNSSFRFDANVRNSPSPSPTIIFGSTIAVPPRGDMARHPFHPIKDPMAGGGAERLTKQAANRNQWQKGGSPVPPPFTISPPRQGPAPESKRSSGSSPSSGGQDVKHPSNPLGGNGVIFTHSLTPDEILKLLEGLDNTKENGGLDHSKGLRSVPLPPRPPPASQRPMLSIGKDTERRGSSLDLPRPSARAQVIGDDYGMRRRGSLDLPRPTYLASIKEKNEGKEKWKLFGRWKMTAKQEEAINGKEKRKKTSIWRNLFKRQQEEAAVPGGSDGDISGPLTPTSDAASDREPPSVASWAARQQGFDLTVSHVQRIKEMDI